MFESEDYVRPWFNLTLKYLSRVISFPIGLSPRTVQDLGSVFRGLAIAKTPFNRSSGSEDTNTYLPELVPPRSTFEVPRAAVALFNLGLKGPTTDLRGSDPWWGRGPRTWCQRLIELWTTWQFSPYGILDWPHASSREFDPTLTSHCTHHCTSNLSHRQRQL